MMRSEVSGEEKKVGVKFGRKKKVLNFAPAFDERGRREEGNRD